MKPSAPVLLALSSFSLLSLLFFFSISIPKPLSFSSSQHHHQPLRSHSPRLKVYVAELPSSLNHGLLAAYWSLRSPDSRILADPDAPLRGSLPVGLLPYPESPLIKQYSSEYWLLADLETPKEVRSADSVAERVGDPGEADVVFVPFFATLSAEMELGWGRKGGFLKEEGNGDYTRQREVVERVRATEAWRRSGGRDHVFVLTGNGQRSTF